MQERTHFLARNLIDSLDRHRRGEKPVEKKRNPPYRQEGGHLKSALGLMKRAKGGPDLGGAVQGLT